MADLQQLGVACVVVGLLIFTVKQAGFIFAKFGSPTLLSKFGDPLKTTKGATKFADQSWQLVIHCTMTVFETYILFFESPSEVQWWQKPETVWMQPVFQEPPRQSLKVLYGLQVATWFITAISHRFFEEYHKDYYVMYGHHLVTIALLVGSYAHMYTEIGLVVLFIHDLSDIPIDLMKMFNYCKMEGPSAFFMTEIWYAATLLVWGYVRLYLFPTKVLWTVWYMAPYVITRDKPYLNGWTNLGTHGEFSLWRSWMNAPFAPGLELYWTAGILLLMLLMMHLYWYCILIKVGYRILTNSSPHEAGADNYEGSQDDLSEHTKKD